LAQAKHHRLNPEQCDELGSDGPQRDLATAATPNDPNDRLEERRLI
jgi:hypothetical protein